MMTIAESAIALDWPQVRQSHRLWLVALGVVQVLAAVLALQLGPLWAWMPVAILTAGAAFLFPRAGVFILATAIYFRWDLPGFTGVYPADALALVVLGGTLTARMAAGRQPIESTPLNKPILMMLAVLALSLVNASFLSAGSVNWLRHAQLFGLCVAVTASLEREDIARLLRGMLLFTAILAAQNTVQFFLTSGTERVFGPLGAFFPLFLSLAIGQGTVLTLMAERRSTRVAWGLMTSMLFLAQIASQARAAWLQVALSLVVLMLFLWRWAGQHRFPEIRSRILALGLVSMAVVAILASGRIALFRQSATRIHQTMAGESLTANTRLFLWRMGWQAFKRSPLLGTGLGQVQHWDETLPQWRFDTMALHARGLGAHNDSITYLSETGVLGLLAILWFFQRTVRMGYRALNRTRRPQDAAALLVLWVPVCGIILAFFFGAHTFYSISGMLTALYIGMLARQCASMAPGAISPSDDRAQR